MVISKDAGKKPLDKIQQSFTIKKNLLKMVIEGIYLNIMKVLYKKQTNKTQ